MWGQLGTSPCREGGTQLQIAKFEDPALKGCSAQLG